MKADDSIEAFRLEHARVALYPDYPDECFIVLRDENGIERAFGMPVEALYGLAEQLAIDATLLSFNERKVT